MTRQPTAYPRLTLSEAVSWLAFGRYLTAFELGLLRGPARMKVPVVAVLNEADGTFEIERTTGEGAEPRVNPMITALPPGISLRMGASERLLTDWLIEGSVKARGIHHDANEHATTHVPAEIPASFLFDGAKVIPTVRKRIIGLSHPPNDSIWRDWDMESFFGNFEQYRDVTIDARELEAAQAKWLRAASARETVLANWLSPSALEEDRRAPKQRARGQSAESEKIETAPERKARRGRKPGDGTMPDGPLVEEMRRLLDAGQAKSVQDAANKVAGKGQGTSPEATVKRLARKYSQARQPEPGGI